MFVGVVAPDVQTIEDMSWPPFAVVDTVAFEQLPSDGPKGRVPVVTDGDGNCLFHAVSIAAFGFDGMHHMLRRRVLYEMVTNEARYEDDEWLQIGIGPGFAHRSGSVSRAIAEQSATFNGLADTRNVIVNDILHAEILENTVDGAWCGLWQVAALANVLKCPVVLVYPKKGAGGAHPELHRTFVPHEKKFRSREPIYIQWSSTQRGGCVNHFVPLLRI